MEGFLPTTFACVFRYHDGGMQIVIPPIAIYMLMIRIDMSGWLDLIRGNLCNSCNLWFLFYLAVIPILPCHIFCQLCPVPIAKRASNQKLCIIAPQSIVFR